MAAPGSEETEKKAGASSSAEAKASASVSKPVPAGTGASANKAPPQPVRRAGGFLSKLLLSLILLLAVLGIAGYGALIFRDSDERVGVAATYVESGLAEAQSALDKAQTSLAELTGAAPPPSAKVTTRRSAPLAQAPQPATPPVEKVAETPAAPTPAPAEAPKEEKAAAPENAAPHVRSEPVAESPRQPVAIAETPAPVTAPAAPAAPEPVRPAAKVDTVDADGFTDRDLISALEGRIEAMSDEIKSLRDKLDAPKNETRAAPETEAPKPIVAAPAPVAVADGAPAAVVVAFALQRELESGRPFTEEIAALSRLGGEPAPAPVLIEISEKGAPTGPQLREKFAPIAKELKAHESNAQTPHDNGDLTGHLLEGASKLIKVRPTGHAHPDSLDGKIEKLEAALTHNDFAAALAAFENLPEAAREEAKEFGEALRQRNEAAKAAEDLLHSAIAALGAKK